MRHPMDWRTKFFDFQEVPRSRPWNAGLTIMRE